MLRFGKILTQNVSMSTSSRLKTHKVSKQEMFKTIHADGSIEVRLHLLMS